MIPSQLNDGHNHLSIRQINSGEGWSELVNAYSSCNLTLSQLCWEVEAGIGQRIALYVALTWSWASITGNIEFPTLKHLYEQDQVEVVGIEIYNVSSDPFGQITAAVIRLKCKYVIQAKVNLPCSRPMRILESQTYMEVSSCLISSSM